MHLWRQFVAINAKNYSSAAVRCLCLCRCDCFRGQVTEGMTSTLIAFLTNKLDKDPLASFGIVG